MRSLACVLGIGGLAAGALAISQVTATAAVARPASGASTHVCNGGTMGVGILAGGTYNRVLVRGVCELNAGVVRVRHDLVIAKGAALVAVFGLNNGHKGSHSRLAVGGDVIVHRGGALVMGCESKVRSNFGHRSAVFACADDPNQSKPTLNSHEFVGGSVIAYHPLGIVVHNSTIRGSVRETGGGGGLTCKPQGVFQVFKSPVYSDYEDNSIGHNMTVIGLRSCWYGNLRNNIHGNMSSSADRLADPDGNEVNSNVVHGSLSCRSNHPAVQYGDGQGTPNRVGGHAFRECGFKVILPDPAPEAHLPVKIKYKHIAVHLHRR